MSLYYKVDDVMKLLECQKRTAYRVIKELNEELVRKGILTMQGKVSKRYFHQRFDIPEKDNRKKQVV